MTDNSSVVLSSVAQSNEEIYMLSSVIGVVGGELMMERRYREIIWLHVNSWYG